MTKKLLSCSFFLFSLVATSQEFDIKGVLIDTNNNPIAYANAVLINIDSTSVVKGAITNDYGVFAIKNIKADNYIFKISFLGFKTYTTRIELNRDIDFETIILEENLQELDGVAVVVGRPTIKRMVDRLVFNVENSTLSNNNVLDVLKHTPSVLVHDGAITIKQSTPTVYINDRKVHLSSEEVVQLLEATPANNIKSIEVITNPPAKYEAEGGVVLNIITSKNIIAGYNGSVFGNYKQGSQFPKYAFGTSHFFKAKKLNTYINYSISPRKDFRHNDEFINFINDDQITSSWETDFKRTRETSNQNINADINYDISKNDHIGFSSNILMSPRRRTMTDINSLTEVYNANGVLDSIFKTINNLTDKKTNLAFTLDYIHQFKKAGEKLSFSTHYTNYDFFSNQNVDTDYRFPNNTLIRNNKFQTLSGQKIKIYTGQLDYELAINDSSVFEAGGKISIINSESDLKQNNFINNQAVLDLQNSDTFLYDEINYATYASYSKDWGKWSLKSGLRVELTDTKGNSLSTNQINNNDYLKLFPSFNLLRRINDNNEVYFNYNKRIRRPKYNQLNPYKYFSNDNSYRVGDPNLKPQIDDIMTLGYTLYNKYTFEVYFRYEKEPIFEIIFQDNENNVLKYVNDNINKSISYGIDFTTYTEITNRLDIYILSSFFYYDNQFFNLENNSVLLKNDKWSLYCQIINYFILSKDRSLVADVSYLYISPIIDGASNISQRSSLNVTLKKTLWNNKASVSLGISDAFNTQNFTQSTKYLNQDAFFNSKLENRLLTIGFNYKFGNFRLSNKKKANDLDEIERLESYYD